MTYIMTVAALDSVLSKATMGAKKRNVCYCMFVTLYLNSKLEVFSDGSAQSSRSIQDLLTPLHHSERTNQIDNLTHQ